MARLQYVPMEPEWESLWHRALDQHWHKVADREAKFEEAQREAHKILRPGDRGKITQREALERIEKGLSLAAYDLSGLSFRNMDLSKLRFTCASLENTKLDGSDLTDSQLDGVNLCYASLKNCKLSYASLQYADAANAIFCQVQLSGLEMQYSNFKCADFRGAGGWASAYMSAAAFNDATVSKNAIDRMPGGFLFELATAKFVSDTSCN